jgi:acetolactate synthase I/II/III large subunit
MTKTTRGADLLVRALRMTNVEQIFTLSGNQIMPVFDACIDETMELIHVRHEAAAVHMADAFGRLTGSPGIALVTAGPGFANTLSALYVALIAESPMVLISGHAPTNQLGRGAFQEMAQAEMAGHVVKASWTVTDATQIGHDMARAFRIAQSGRPGPVQVSVPVDLLDTVISKVPSALPHLDDFSPIVNLLDVPTAESILDSLTQAKNPLIIGGTAFARGDGNNIAQSLSATLNVPMVAMESPRGLNDPSLGRFSNLVKEADVILLLGQPLNFMLRFGEEPAFRADCQFAIIEPEMPMLEHSVRVLNNPQRQFLAALADPIPSAERLLQVHAMRKGETKPDRTELSQSNKFQWTEKVCEAISFRPLEWATVTADEQHRLHPAELCRGLQRWLDADDDAILISDGGEFGQWAQACLSAPRRLINGASGSIGSAIPFALAARCVSPESRILTCLGDGTMGFHALEFETAVRHDLPFVAVIGNDACWNAERQIQLRRYGSERLIGCDLLPTRYDEIVKSLGGHGEFVEQAEGIESALERASASRKPACVNVSIEGHAAPNQGG